MTTTSKPWWQQATAVVSLGATGTITGFSVTPHGPAHLPKPTPAQVRLLALRQMAKPAASTDVTFRSAIVNAAQYYLRLAQTRTPYEMEALIWEHDSIGGADHGESCAAFASLTLELASKVTGRESWVTGGTSYPWPLHAWADVRVDANPASPGITSVLQDAQAHHRWHRLGDRYRPLPGDWVLFDGHVEVVTKYSHGVLSTIGGDSLPNFSVNAHEYRVPLGTDGVVGFVDNAEQPATAGPSSASGASDNSASASNGSDGQTSADVDQAATQNQPATANQDGSQAQTADASIPGVGVPIPASGHAHRHRPAANSRARTQTAHTHHTGAPQDLAPGHAGGTAEADVPGAVRFGPPATFQRASHGAAAIPGAGAAGKAPAGSTGSARSGAARRAQPAPAAAAPVQLTKAQRAFIAQVSPGAIAAQRQYGVPASVTIAQAINESGWGQSGLATQSHNLFGMKGSGPAGSDTQLTDEYVDGHWQVTIASFRAYHNVAQSIEDHGKLLATGGDYRAAMDQRDDPDAFASALTGVYATNPQYGQDLVSLMKQYHLYQYDQAAPAHPAAPKAHPAKPGAASIPGLTSPTKGPPAAVSPPAPAQHPGGSRPGSMHTGTGAHATGPAGGRGAPGHSGRPRHVGTPAPVSTPSPPVPSVPASHPAPTTPPRATGSAPTTRRGLARPAGTATGTTPARTSPRATAPTSSARARTAPQAQIPGATSAPRATQTGPVRGGSARPVAPAPEPSPSAKARTQTATLLAERTPAPAPRSAMTATARVPAPRHVPAPARLAPGEHETAARYDESLPRPVRNSFLALANVPLQRSESLYQDVASGFGLRWELLATCDWMQCEAKPRYSPVHGEKLGTRNPDHTVYRTKSEALAQCAEELIELADAVYGIDLTSGADLSVRDLANVYAAFRWGALLKAHRTSAMEFPYSVAGLTVHKINMRWPNIDEPHAPDRPGTRFRMPFGAVPVLRCLNYPVMASPLVA
ncbi:MAG TPA: glucosaminidase domain-containing protein [Streptosporangiaceae bacterium]|nr:glucosaminidase domain-containing protein [Streptosporangiaceae bacterium]